MRRIVQLIVAVFVVLLGLAFHIRNHEPVALDFYFYSMELPLSWVVVGAFSGGAITGLFLMTNAVLRARGETRRLAKKHEIATEEIVNLRAIPLKNSP